jgi:hypothetical protein
VFDWLKKLFGYRPVVELASKFPNVREFRVTSENQEPWNFPGTWGLPKVNDPLPWYSDGETNTGPVPVLLRWQYREDSGLPGVYLVTYVYGWRKDDRPGTSEGTRGSDG